MRWVTHYGKCFTYTLRYLLVVDVSCVLFCQSACIVPKKNTPNIYHRQMNNGVNGRSHKTLGSFPFLFFSHRHPLPSSQFGYSTGNKCFACSMDATGAGGGGEGKLTRPRILLHPTSSFSLSPLPRSLPPPGIHTTILHLPLYSSFSSTRASRCTLAEESEE